MSFDDLKREVWDANIALSKSGLVLFTWGNVSGADRKAGVIAIKPSGVSYSHLSPSDIVVVSISDGVVIDGDMRPSSDTPTHLELYRAFDDLGGVVHTHSAFATSWAQANKPIPCFGTTHADYFYGPVPVTRQLTPEEIGSDYEANTGRVIVEHFLTNGIDPSEIGAVLVPNHGVFAWGKNPMKALENAVVTEEVAKMSVYTLLINPSASPLSETLLNKHFLRKHGPGAYYGQK